ncbi:MAG TPA: ATP-binding cassette domain-containing protein [Bacteroidetes bacterium]|nr:ATP-binding cassette domain-containing protein [Bacteroidota bacterium]
MKTDSVIKVEKLTAILDDKIILSDVSFKAYSGDVTAILGSSGSGKTVLLKHLLGLYPGEGNAVSVMGLNPSQLDEGQQKHFYTRLGVFYQNGALLNSLTVGENVALPLHQHTDLPPDLIERLVKLKLRLVNLQGSYNMFPSSLSGGMLKRAALARAIIMDPPLLFCDEPGSGLDPVSLASLDNLILNLQKLLGMTVIMITHEVSSIFRVADRIIFIDQGKVIFEGTLPEALKSQNKALMEFFRKGRGD